MSTQSSQPSEGTRFVGNDRVLFGIIFGVLAFWLFAQTTLNISPVMADDLGIETSVMNIAVRYRSGPSALGAAPASRHSSGV